MKENFKTAVHAFETVAVCNDIRDRHLYGTLRQANSPRGYLKRTAPHSYAQDYNHG